jgi:hypothetical protein
MVWMHLLYQKIDLLSNKLFLTADAVNVFDCTFIGIESQFVFLKHEFCFLEECGSLG